MMNEQQLKNFFQTPMGRKMMMDTEKYFAEKQTELANLQGQKAMIQNELGRLMTGDPSHRNTSILKSVDGTLLKVVTNDFANVKEVQPVKSFAELTTQERTQLFETDKKLYKMLEHGLYQPTMNEKIIDLMITDGIKYEEFSLLADTPQKPNLNGLDITESSRLVAEYTKSSEDHTAKLNAYRTTMADYQSGKINQDLRDVETKINEVQAELS
jgi:hypothetical protein